MNGPPAPKTIRGLSVGQAFVISNRTVVRVSKLDYNSVYYRVYSPDAALPSMAHEVRRSTFDEMIETGKAIRVEDYDEQ